MEFSYEKAEKRLRKELDPGRYRHTMGVSYTAACLAMVHGGDFDKARIAGLLHDCAKCISNDKQIICCRKAGIVVTDFERKNPFLLHAKLGSYLAETVYGIKDSEILNAITWHTTGKPRMTLLEKIIYIADYMEPNRYKAPNLAEIRRLAFQDLDQCMYQILEDTVGYLKKDPKTMDVTTEAAYQFYKQKVKKEG
mgnify:FL=1